MVESGCSLGQIVGDVCGRFTHFMRWSNTSCTCPLGLCSGLPVCFGMDTRGHYCPPPIMIFARQSAATRKRFVQREAIAMSGGYGAEWERRDGV